MFEGYDLDLDMTVRSVRSPAKRTPGSKYGAGFLFQLLALIELDYGISSTYATTVTLEHTENIDARIQKRRLLHPAITSPYSGASLEKVIYVSASTPFVSVIKRARKLLDQADKRSMGKVSLVDGSGSDRAKMQAVGSIENAPRSEPVVLKGTGRATERVMEVGLWFQAQPDCKVRLLTGSMAVVDDIVEGGGNQKRRKTNKRTRTNEGEGVENISPDKVNQQDIDQKEKTETPESQHVNNLSTKSPGKFVEAAANTLEREKA
ncbi:MAG: hypothetical protein M1834_002717 [Cirrosporium novae-zelandiae]|nr:MAG: hypothetical protein M1834_002717 [Cirrosporium novae-zelandiae]